MHPPDMNKKINYKQESRNSLEQPCQHTGSVSSFLFHSHLNTFFILFNIIALIDPVIAFVGGICLGQTSTQRYT